MSVSTIKSLRAFLFLMLNTEMRGDEVVDFAMRAFNASHADVSRTWNNMLCAKHGV